MLTQSYCTTTELIARLGGTFCGEKLVTGFGLLKRGAEIDPKTFTKQKLDDLVKQDKFIGKLPFFNAEDNDQEADFNTSVRKERTKTMPGVKGFKFFFDRGSSFQNELAKLDRSKYYSFIPIFEDGSALFAVKKNGMLTGFDCNTFVDIKKLQFTSEPAGSTLQVDITPDGMVYWQNSAGVYESDDFSFNELQPVAKLTIKVPVLTNNGASTKVKVVEASSGANIVGLTQKNDWKIEIDGVATAVTNVTYDETAQEYTITHPAVTSRKKVRFITSNNGVRIISVDSNFYTGESELQTVA